MLGGLRLDLEIVWAANQLVRRAESLSITIFIDLNPPQHPSSVMNTIRATPWLKDLEKFCHSFGPQQLFEQDTEIGESIRSNSNRWCVLLCL